MPRRRSYRQHKQGLVRMQTEIGYHRLAKARRKMLAERHKRAADKANPELHRLRKERADMDYEIEMDQLEWQMRSYYMKRLEEEQKFNAFAKIYPPKVYDVPGAYIR